MVTIYWKCYEQYVAGLKQIENENMSPKIVFCMLLRSSAAMIGKLIENGTVNFYQSKLNLQVVLCEKKRR